MQTLLKSASGMMTAPYFGIAVYQYLLSFSCIVVGFILRRVCAGFFAKFEDAAKKTDTRIDDILVEILRKPLPPAFVVLGIFFAVHNLPKPPNIQTFLEAGFKSLTVLFGLWVGLRVVDEVFVEWAKYAKSTQAGFDDQLIPILQKSLKVFLVIIGVILFLQNMGYSVGGLMAGFGLGGAAVAMASKDSISNLFGSIVVVFDRPFRVGDWIEMDGSEGTVEGIGLRTTKIRTFANSVMTVPNAKFTTSVINNWSKMSKRRITFRLGLTYGTPADKIEATVGKIRELIQNDDNLRKDFFIVNFDAFGPSSLDILIYCFTRTTNWKDFLDAKQKFFLNIVRETRKLGVEIAFPTQTLHVGSPIPVKHVAD